MGVGTVTDLDHRSTVDTTGPPELPNRYHSPTVANFLAPRPFHPHPPPQAYVTYEFYGSNGREQFTTNQMEEGITHAPVLDYTFVHHVPVVTQEFVDFLESPIPLQLYVSPAVDSKALRKTRPVSTSNQAIRRALMGDDEGAGSDPFVRASELEKENAFLKR